MAAFVGNDPLVEGMNQCLNISGQSLPLPLPSSNQTKCLEISLNGQWVVWVWMVFRFRLRYPRQNLSYVLSNIPTVRRNSCWVKISKQIIWHILSYNYLCGDLKLRQTLLVFGRALRAFGTGAVSKVPSDSTAISSLVAATSRICFYVYSMFFIPGGIYGTVMILHCSISDDIFTVLLYIMLYSPPWMIPGNFCKSML